MEKTSAAEIDRSGDKQPILLPQTQTSGWRRTGGSRLSTAIESPLIPVERSMISWIESKKKPNPKNATLLQRPDSGSSPILLKHRSEWIFRVQSLVCLNLDRQIGECRFHY
jgi:hypothetical protein